MPPAFPKRKTYKERYIEYINGAEWLKKRKTVLENPYYGRSNECFLCRKDKHLQVHHLSYAHVFNERDDELIILCNKCHSETHFYTGKKNHNNIDINVFLQKFRGLMMTEDIKRPHRKNRQH